MFVPKTVVVKGTHHLSAQSAATATIYTTEVIVLITVVLCFETFLTVSKLQYPYFNS